MALVTDSGGQRFDPDSLPQTLSYNGDQTLAYVQVSDGVSTWRQSYTYTNGALTGISAWVRQ